MKSLGIIITLIGLALAASCAMYFSPDGAENLQRDFEKQARDQQTQMQNELNALRQRTGEYSVSSAETDLEAKYNRQIDEAKSNGDRLQDKRESTLRLLAISGGLSVLIGLILISSSTKSKSVAGA